MAGFLFGVPVSGAIGGLLASGNIPTRNLASQITYIVVCTGFLKSDGFGMVRTWRVIFFGEGLITMGLSVIMYLILPDGPAEAKFLNADEKGELRIPRNQCYDT